MKLELGSEGINRHVREFENARKHRNLCKEKVAVTDLSFNKIILPNYTEWIK